MPNSRLIALRMVSYRGQVVLRTMISYHPIRYVASVSHDWPVLQYAVGDTYICCILLASEPEGDLILLY